MSKSRPRVVIVGGGLGGCLVAHRLAESAEVTIVEQGASDGLYLVDEGAPLRIAPYAGSGLGGATRFWANGLIEPAERAFEDWPFDRAVLDPWLEDAHLVLGGATRAAVRADADLLAALAIDLGIAAPVLGHPLYYPPSARNVWDSLGLARRVAVVRGYVDELALDPVGRVTSVGTRTLQGRRRLEADLVVLAAGGLGTPGVLQLLARRSGGSIAGQAGHHYDDHPSAFVAEFTGPFDLARFWGDVGPATGGNVRLPFVVDTPGASCAFYVRPVGPYRMALRSARSREALDEAMDRPWSPGSYARLLSRSTDVAAVAAGRAGLGGDPTRFNLFMIAGLKPSAESYVWQEDVLGPVHRRWHIEPAQIEELREASATVLASLAGIVDDVEVYSGWHDGLESAAHHSGTARLARSPAEGVCDADCRVFDVPNLYVGDGSLIPWSGFANTGLAIGALALRLGDHLKETLG